MISVPPTKVLIYDMENKELSGVIGPYDEGSELKLRCESDGGNILHPFKYFYYFKYLSIPCSKAISNCSTMC